MLSWLGELLLRTQQAASGGNNTLLLISALPGAALFDRTPFDRAGYDAMIDIEEARRGAAEAIRQATVTSNLRRRAVYLKVAIGYDHIADALKLLERCPPEGRAASRQVVEDF